MTSAIKTTPDSLLSSIGWLIPQILAIIAIFLPIFNGSPEKSMVFMILSGCLITASALASWQEKTNTHTNGLLCNMFYLVDTESPDCPSKNTLFVTFTCIYLISPMIVYDTYNYYSVIALLLFLGVHMAYQATSGCSSFKCYMPSFIWGGFVGYISVFFITKAGLERFLYFSELADSKIICNKSIAGWNTCS